MNRKEEELTFSTSEINPKEAYIPRKNKSCFFVLPLLGQPSYWYYGLINCYLKDKINKPRLKDKLFINLRNYDNKVLNIVYFNQFYQLEDKTYMYVFDIPDEYKEDYNKFKEGQYSHMSGNAKNLICKLSGIKPVMESVVYKVLYKTADQKLKIENLIGERLSDTAEVFSIPSIERETYSLFGISHSKTVEAVEKEESERE